MTRIVLLALLVLGALAAPAGAQSPPSTADLARGPEALVRQAQSNLMAACRRQGGCPTRESEVAAFEASETARILDFQFGLGDAVPLREAQWPATHNSANSASEEFTPSGGDHNQQLSLRDQLRLRMRSLELDVHWFPSRRAGGAHAPVVCHARGAGEMHAGCSDERLLSQRLPEIATWLGENPDQVLLLYVEDHLYQARGTDADHLRAHDTAAADLEAHLGERIYRPAGGCGRLPLDLTRQDVLAAGKQVVLVAKDCGRGAAWGSLVFDWSRPAHEEARPRRFDARTCGPDFTRAQYDATLIRYYEDTTLVSAGLWPTGAASLDDGLTPATTRAMVGCGVDLFGFDQILPADGRLQAMVWAWSPRRDRCAALGDAPDPWQARKCDQTRAYGCRTAEGDWTVLGPAGPWSGGAATCAAAGATFTTPRTGWENRRLVEAADGRPTWVASAGPTRSKRSARRTRR